MNNSKKFYKWFYDNIHSHYYNILMKWCFFPFGGENKIRNMLLAKIDFKNDKKILDMCCGTGNTTFVIANKCNVNTVIKGIDLSDGQIRIACKKNKYSNIDFHVADATKTPFLNNEFDKIIIPHALHEMKRDVRLKVLKETQRILKKGGTIIILEMDNPPKLSTRMFIGLIWFYWLPFNFETPTRRDMLKHGLINELKEAGFINLTKESVLDGIFQIVHGQC
jgi:ubiquinone/menaquinone biosynthesis C-methylase UbiE